MTEREWLACADPVLLLAHLNRPREDRKLLLYAVACCRLLWDVLEHLDSRIAVDWAEDFADGLEAKHDRYAVVEYRSEGAAFALERIAQTEGIADWADESEPLSNLRGRVDNSNPLRVCAAYLANALLTLGTTDPYDPSLRAYSQCLAVAPLRCVFGNPFRPVAFDPTWRTETAVTLARQMYDSREFGAMPILADALQDAGCNSEEVLAHCRDTSASHVRGCWVVDLVLGRA